MNTTKSAQYRVLPPGRWIILGGPGGYLTALPAGDERRSDRYRAWTELARLHVRRAAVSLDAAYNATLRVWSLA